MFLLLVGATGLALFVLISALLVHLGRRHNRVMEYRAHLLAIIGEASDRDIWAGRDWRWRLDIFKSVTYASMLYKFWKPLPSFYPDKSFLE